MLGCIGFSDMAWTSFKVNKPHLRTKVVQCIFISSQQNVFTDGFLLSFIHSKFIILDLNLFDSKHNITEVKNHCILVV